MNTNLLYLVRRQHKMPELPATVVATRARVSCLLTSLGRRNSYKHIHHVIVNIRLHKSCHVYTSKCGVLKRMAEGRDGL